MMEPILEDFSQDRLIEAIKSNLYIFFRQLKNTPLSEYYDGEGFERWHTPIAHPWFNGVFARRLPDEGDEEFIQETLTYFQRHGVTAHSWWLEPSIPIEAWQPRLAAYGYQYLQDPPGMAIDLDYLPVGVPHNEHLVIQEIHDTSDFDTWGQVFLKGYGLPDSMADALKSIYASLGLELPFRYYLGILDGQPVATSGLFLGAGVAGIYNVATLSEARGQGVGAALTLLPLHQARSMGYRAGILQSSEMGFGLYQRLGFEKLCDMEHFLWMGDITE